MQFIPRGSVIKNSGDCLVLVVYTGSETKLMQNLGSYKFKRSQVEKRVGTALIMNLILMFVFICVASIWNFVKTKEIFESHHYITDSQEMTATEVSLASIVSFYLLFN